MVYPIVIPLHPGGGKFGNDTEARFTIRSIHRHFRGEFQLAIASKRLPRWASNIELINDGGKGLKTTILMAAERFPSGFFWWYDDCSMLRDDTPEGLKITPACKGWTQLVGTSWMKSLGDVHKRLEENGHAAYDYSRPHGPYWFDQDMINEAFEDWPGMSGKFPFESWILSKRDWPRRFGVVKQYYGPFNNSPGEQFLLNYNDIGNTQELRDFLRLRFPNPSPYEVSEDYHRVFFIHVPKAAGSSVIASLGNRCVVAEPTKQLMWSDKASLRVWMDCGRLPVAACVRDPVDRAVSLYNYFRGREFPADEPAYRVMREMLRHMSLSQFWETADLPYLATVIRHLRPQHEYLSGAPIEYLLRFENLEKDYTRLANTLECQTVLKHLNGGEAHDRDLTDAARDRIRQFYELDYHHYYR